MADKSGVNQTPLHVNKIFKLQNRALRIINVQAHDVNTDALYRSNKILKLEDFIRLQHAFLFMIT